MLLARFLNNLFKERGFILLDANSKKYVIGKPEGEKPLVLKLFDKSLHYELLIYPDLYFGEAYTDGKVTFENGTLSDFLDLALENIGRQKTNTMSDIFNTFRYFVKNITKSS